MSVKKYHYEELLAEYSNPQKATQLLKQYRPYLEMVPSMRRPYQSLITIPLPIVRITPPLILHDNHTSRPESRNENKSGRQSINLPCDLAILMCDPEWKVKMGAEILVFIHRYDEDFYDLLSRWRKCEVWLDKSYEWVMPLRYKHIYGDGGEKIYPLFVLFSESQERIKRGLKGSGLPFIVQNIISEEELQEQEKQKQVDNMTEKDEKEEPSITQNED